jgi:hypothetical protein
MECTVLALVVWTLNKDGGVFFTDNNFTRNIACECSLWSLYGDGATSNGDIDAGWNGDWGFTNS